MGVSVHVSREWKDETAVGASRDFIILRRKVVPVSILKIELSSEARV